MKDEKVYLGCSAGPGIEITFSPIVAGLAKKIKQEQVRAKENHKRYMALRKKKK